MLHRIILILCLSICLITGCEQTSELPDYDQTIIHPLQYDYELEAQTYIEHGTIMTLSNNAYLKVYDKNYKKDPDMNISVCVYSSDTRSFYQEVKMYENEVNTQDLLQKGPPLDYDIDLSQVITEQFVSGNRFVYFPNIMKIVSENHIIQENVIENNDDLKVYKYFNFLEQYEPIDLSKFEIPKDITKEIENACNQSF